MPFRQYLGSDKKVQFAGGEIEQGGSDCAPPADSVPVEARDAGLRQEGAQDAFKLLRPHACVMDIRGTAL